MPRQRAEQRLVLTVDGRQSLILTAERILICMDTGVIRLKCRRCGEMRTLGEFGVRRMKAHRDCSPRRNQAWCQPCRKPAKAASGAAEGGTTW